MSIDLASGSTLSICGADRPDSLRGDGLDFVVLDEFTSMHPEAWTEVFRPALSDRKGRALFIGTPKGRNHFYDHFEYAKTDPDWAAFQFTTAQGGIVDRDELRAAARQKRLGMAKAGTKLGLPGKLLSLDATVIDLCAAVFDWAQFRTTKGAVKLHLLLDHDGYLPCYAVITEGKVHEIQVARKLKWQRGTMLVFERGYTDYAWFQRLTEESVHFVTRLKDNAACIIVENRRTSGEGVLADEILMLEKQAVSDVDGAPFLRRVRYRDETTQRELVFLTNHLELPAATIAAVYKERWQIELLFKALKQNLRIKTFVGTTANALKTQIWTALIALLAVKFLQLQAKFPWSLSRLIALLRQQLFVYRNLWAWIESPFEPPLPLTAEDSPQLPFAWAR